MSLPMDSLSRAAGTDPLQLFSTPAPHRTGSQTRFDEHLHAPAPVVRREAKEEAVDQRDEDNDEVTANVPPAPPANPPSHEDSAEAEESEETSEAVAESTPPDEPHPEKLDSETAQLVAEELIPAVETEEPVAEETSDERQAEPVVRAVTTKQLRPDIAERVSVDSPAVESEVADDQETTEHVAPDSRVDAEPTEVADVEAGEVKSLRDERPTDDALELSPATEPQPELAQEIASTAKPDNAGPTTDRPQRPVKRPATPGVEAPTRQSESHSSSVTDGLAATNLAQTAGIIEREAKKGEGRRSEQLASDPLAAASGSREPDAGAAPSTSRLAEHLLAKADERTAKNARLTDVDQARFLDRVARAFRAAESRQGVVKLRLHPPELGSLRIELRVQNGGLTARLEAETPVARHMLVEHAQTLRDRLAEQGVRVDRFDVDVMDRRPPDQHEAQERQSDGAARPVRDRQRDLPAVATELVENRPLRPGPGNLNVII